MYARGGENMKNKKHPRRSYELKSLPTKKKIKPPNRVVSFFIGGEGEI
jgi:hypothetical protein